MKNIDRLLNDLNNMSPLSVGFWKDLQPMMEEKRKKNGHIFLKPGKFARKAWQLISGFIVSVKISDTGDQFVARIYYPKDIVTDLESFFENVPVRYQFIGIGETLVLEINKPDVIKLLQYPETNKLIQHITILENKALENLVEMLRLSDIKKVTYFLTYYQIGGLPAQYCASLLNLPLDIYLAYLEELAQLENIKPRIPTSGEQDTLENTSNEAYLIKAYLLVHYKDPDIGNTKKIAAQFNMTSVTLDRLFIKHFDFTIYKFITMRRMRKADELLKDGKLAIGQVASAVGYKNIFHFSKIFKSYYGYPPKQGRGS